MGIENKLSKSLCQLKIRRRVIDSFLNDPLLKILFQHYESTCKTSHSFSVPLIPKSLNHQYGKGKNKRTGKTAFWLVDEIKTLRQACAFKLRHSPIKHFSKTHAIIVFENPQWITKKNTVRKMDVDNKIKPIFDAIEKATGFPDENIFAFHTFKAVGQKQNTHVWLFDMGDIVDCY